jgi:flotillin
MADTVWLGILIIMIVGACLALIVIYKINYKRVPPNKAMIVFGKKNPRTKIGYRILTGGGKFIMPIVEDVAYLPLDVRKITLDLKKIHMDVERSNKLVDVKITAFIKISSQSDLLHTAAEQLLGKTDDEINSIAREILETHLEGMLATIDIKTLKTDRDLVATRIQATAAADLMNMGLEIRSFAISNIREKSY